MTEDNKGSFADRFGAKKPSPIEKEQSSNNVASLAEKYKSKKEKKMSAVNAAPDMQRKRADANLLFLVKGIDDNRPAWYYVLVDRLKLHMFKKALNDNIIHLEEYGKILYSAYGEDPPEEIKQKIKEEFGISDD